MSADTDTAVRAATARRTGNRLAIPGRKTRQWTKALWSLPALILIIGIVHYSIVMNVVYSTWEWSGVSPEHENVGGTNYLAMINDPVVWKALLNTVIFAVVAVSAQLVLGFLLAVLVRTRSYGRALLRTLIFIPVVLSPAIVATSFRILLAADGPFNDLLRSLGLGTLAHPWLADPSTALATIIAINIWQYTGYSFVIYDAALAQIDPAIIEAARIDGASTGQLLRRVIFPLVSGSHVVLLVLGVISALKTFDVVFLTTGGGPGVTTEIFGTYIYRLVITQFDAGYGAAISVILIAIALLFAALQAKLSQRST